MSEFLSLVNFENLFSNSEINEAVDSFYDVMLDLCDRFIKKIDIVEGRNNYPWENDSILRNLKNRKRKMKKRLNNFSDMFENRFKCLCDEYESRYKLVYDKYVDKVQKGILQNPKNFWELVDRKRSDKSLPDKMFLDDNHT